MSTIIKATKQFDRNNPVPPDYLPSLRVAGRRRAYWQHPSNEKPWSQGSRSYCPRYGQALRSALDYLPVSRRLFLDAGCGDSPDADLSLELGFKRAVKIDLYPLTPNRLYMWDRAKFIQGDICNLDELVKPGTVDMITCSAVLDLMPFEDRVLFYRAAAEVLAYGGVLSINYVWLAAGWHDWNSWGEGRALRDAGLNMIAESHVHFICRKEQK